jgi:hypothetical protein
MRSNDSRLSRIGPWLRLRTHRRRRVKTHRFVFTTCRGEQSAEEFAFGDDHMAIVDARARLVDDVIAIAVRRTDGASPRRVGLWIMRRGQPEWRRFE